MLPVSGWLRARKHHQPRYQIDPRASSFCPHYSRGSLGQDRENRLMGLVQNTNSAFPPQYENNAWSQGVITGSTAVVAFIENSNCPLIALLRIPSLVFFLPCLLLLPCFTSFLLSSSNNHIQPPPLHQPVSEAEDRDEWDWELPCLQSGGKHCQI